jgi:hypothetical protein
VFLDSRRKVESCEDLFQDFFRLSGHKIIKIKTGAPCYFFFFDGGVNGEATPGATGA